MSKSTRLDVAGMVPELPSHVFSFIKEKTNWSGKAKE